MRLEAIIGLIVLSCVWMFAVATNTIGMFFVIAAVACLPVSLLITFRRRGGTKFRIVLGLLFASGWMVLASYLEMLRAALQTSNDTTEITIERIVATTCLLPACGLALLLWRAWMYAVNENASTLSG